MELPVEAEEQLPLRLYGRFNPRTGNYNFILFYSKIRIRALDVGKRHHNPECDNVGFIHMHKWTDRNRDKWAYEPDAVGDELTIKHAFNKMLEACNITHQETFMSPPGGHQRGF